MERNKATGKNPDLRERVKKAVLDRLQLSGEGINIEVKGRDVTLSGVVDVLAEKQEAGEAAGSVPGVRAVDNSLTVGMEGQIDDDQIKKLVEERIMADPRLELRRIGVRVHDGVVYLLGEVDSLAEQELAVSYCRRVQGVKNVVNRMAGPRKGERDDASIVNAVELNFSRTLSLDPGDIHTSCRNGVVTLEGYVEEPEMAVAALRAASRVKGVRDIVNRIEIGYGDPGRDALLTNELRRRLAEHPLVSPAQVKAFVVGNWAFLAGEVYSPDAKKAAGQIAYQLKGITGVTNELEIVKH